MKYFFVFTIVLFALFAPLFSATTLHAQAEPPAATAETTSAHPYAGLRDKTWINTENSSRIMSIFTSIMAVLLIGSIVYMSRGPKTGADYTNS